MSLGGLGAGGAQSVKDFMSMDADNYGNRQDVEAQWAMKAFHHAEVYFSLIKTVDPKILKITKLDDEIYTDFRARFKDMNVEIVNEDEMKSEAGKAKWREFCNEYKGRVEDFNMGTLLRVNANEDVNEHNTTLVPRIQFLAIEIARNREGFNSNLRAKFGVAAPKKSASDENDNADKKDTATTENS